MAFYYIIIYTAVFLAAAGQILLKLGAGAEGIDLGLIRINAWVIGGLGAMVASMLLSVRALSVIPLRDMAFILPAVYVLVPVFSALLLKERMGKKNLYGTLLMISGIILFNIPFLTLWQV